MFKHILIPTDGSDLSRKAVLYGVRLAKESGAKVTALTIAEPYRVASMDAVLIAITEDEYEEESRRMSEKALNQVKMAAEAADVPCETIREIHDQPYRAIIDAAHALKTCAVLREPVISARHWPSRPAGKVMVMMLASAKF